MGQQLHMRYKRQRRHKWIDRKKKAAKAQPKAGPPPAEKPAVAKAPPVRQLTDQPTDSDRGLGESSAKPAEAK